MNEEINAQSGQAEKAQADSSSEAAGRDNNAGDVKAELEARNQELASVKEALRREREKNRRSGISSPSEESGKRSNKEIEEAVYRVYEEKAREERIAYEIEAKKEFLRRFPSIAANNDIGLSDDIVDNYNLLLRGQKSSPRTKEGVVRLLEDAVKISRPDLFVSEYKARQEQNNYEGMESSQALEGEIKNEENIRRNPRETQIHNYFNQRIKQIKKSRGITA